MAAQGDAAQVLQAVLDAERRGAADEDVFRRGLAAAAALGEDRHAAYLNYRMGESLGAQNRYAAAEAAYAKSLQLLRAAGPPAAADEARLSGGVYTLRPDIVLVARGLALKRQGKVGAAEAAYVEALEPALCDGWPLPFGASQTQPAMQAVSNLVTMYEERSDAARREARMRQWRELLLSAGVDVPSDTEAWLDYELVRLRGVRPTYNSAAPLELLARAERVHPAGDVRLGRFLRFCANFMSQTAAVAALERALALARQPGGNAFLSHSDALTTLTALGHMHLRLPPGSAGPSTPAAKTAALGAFAEAAAMFSGEDARKSMDWAMLLEKIVRVSDDPVGQGIPDIRIQLSGRLVSLHEPDGLGRIALSEEALRVRNELQGDSSPALIAPLMAHGMLLNHHYDVMEAAVVLARAAKLAAAKLGGSHSTAREAREQAKSAEDNLKLLQASVLSTNKTLERRTAQLAWRHIAVRSGIARAEAANGSEKADAKAVLARANRASDRLQRHDPPCAGCGAVRGSDAPHFKLCSACSKVAYCGAECQKAHWKRAHKRECATLAGAPASKAK